MKEKHERLARLALAYMVVIPPRQGEPLEKYVKRAARELDAMLAGKKQAEAE